MDGALECQLQNSLGQYGQKVCPFADCTCAGRKLGAGLSGVQHTFTLILSFSLSCVEPGNDMSLSEVLSALTMIMLHCYSQTGKAASDGGRVAERTGKQIDASGCKHTE